MLLSWLESLAQATAETMTTQPDEVPDETAGTPDRRTARNGAERFYHAEPNLGPA